MKKLICILLCLLVLAAAGIYCVVELRKPDFEILIGMQKGDDAVDYTRSTPLTDSEDIDTVIFTLMQTVPLQEVAAQEHSPSAVIMISRRNSDTAYSFSLWLSDNKVIIHSPNNTYYAVRGAQAEALRAIVEDQLAKY